MTLAHHTLEPRTRLAQRNVTDDVGPLELEVGIDGFDDGQQLSSTLVDRCRTPRPTVSDGRSRLGHAFDAITGALTWSLSHSPPKAAWSRRQSR